MRRHRMHTAIAMAMGIVVCSRADAQQTGALQGALADPASCLERDVSPVAPARGDTSARQTRDSVRRDTSLVPAGRGPAIILLASASAREVRFARQPRISVRLCGGVMDSVRVLERRNLPDPVQPGVTYRDVFISVEILGHLNAECLAGRITGSDRRPGADCASLQLRDSARAGARRPPP